MGLFSTFWGLFSIFRNMQKVRRGSWWIENSYSKSLDFLRFVSIFKYSSAILCKSLRLLRFLRIYWILRGVLKTVNNPFTFMGFYISLILCPPFNCQKLVEIWIRFSVLVKDPSVIIAIELDNIDCAPTEKQLEYKLEYPWKRLSSATYQDV